MVSWALYRLGVRVRPMLEARSVLPGSFMLLLPVLISNVLGNFGPAFVQIMSSRAGEGGISAFGYASRLHNTVMQAVVMSVSVVLLPHFARLISEQRHAELHATLERVFAATLVFFLAAFVFVAASGEWSVGLLLERGRFDSADTQLVAHTWLALTSGLLGATWGIFLVRYFQALQQPWAIAKLSVVSVAANVAFSLLLWPRLGVIGVALANSLAYLVVTAGFHWMAARRLGSFLTPQIRAFIVSALALNLVAYGLAMIWMHLCRDARLLVIVGQALIVGGANLLLLPRAPLRIAIKALLR
jgi:putative peptidoglycan lipid II flippase